MKISTQSLCWFTQFSFVFIIFIFLLLHDCILTLPWLNANNPKRGNSSVEKLWILIHHCMPRGKERTKRITFLLFFFLCKLTSFVKNNFPFFLSPSVFCQTWLEDFWNKHDPTTDFLFFCDRRRGYMRLKRPEPCRTPGRSFTWRRLRLNHAFVTGTSALF